MSEYLGWLFYFYWPLVALAIILIYGGWRIFKYCAYELAYAIGKGLKDAKRE